MRRYKKVPHPHRIRISDDESSDEELITMHYDSDPGVGAKKQEDRGISPPRIKIRTPKRALPPVATQQNSSSGVRPVLRPSQASASARQNVVSQASAAARQNVVRPRVKVRHTYKFDYASAIREANQEAKRAGVVEVHRSEVDQTFEDGSMTGVHHWSKHAASQKYFFAFVGDDLVACIPELGMLNLVLHDLVLLQAGIMSDGMNPTEVELEHNYHEMEGPLGSDRWAVHIQTKTRAIRKARTYYRHAPY